MPKWLLSLLLAGLISQGVLFAQDDTDPAPPSPPTPIVDPDPIVDPHPEPKPDDKARLEFPIWAPPATQIQVTLKGLKRQSGDQIIWYVFRGADKLDEKNFRDFGGFILLTGPESKEPYRVYAVYVAPQKRIDLEAAITIAAVPPGPPVPDPVDPPSPTPDPQPTPPKPGKIRFLAIRDDLNQPQDVLRVLDSQEVREYLKSHAFIDEKGIPEVRFFDDDYTDEQILLTHNQMWLDAYKKAKADRAAAGKGDDFPWILISNGTDGESLPCPDSKEALLQILKKWGGE